jgi:hypothetical protein
MMVKDSLNSPIPKDYDELLAQWLRVRRSILKRLINKRSFRYLAKKFGVSHPTIMRIQREENYVPSRKLMIRIMQRYKKPKVVMKNNVEKLNVVFDPVITIFGDVLSTKNHTEICYNRKTKKPFVMKSKVSKKQEESLDWQLKSQRIKWGSMVEKSGCGKGSLLKVSFKFFRSTDGIFDYANIIQGLADAMVRVGYLVGDDARHFLPVFEQYEIDAKNPRTEIKIKN